MADPLPSGSPQETSSIEVVKMSFEQRVILYCKVKRGKSGRSRLPVPQPDKVNLNLWSYLKQVNIQSDSVLKIQISKLFPLAVHWEGAHKDYNACSLEWTYFFTAKDNGIHELCKSAQVTKQVLVFCLCFFQLTIFRSAPSLPDPMLRLQQVVCHQTETETETEGPLKHLCLHTHAEAQFCM